MGKENQKLQHVTPFLEQLVGDQEGDLFVVTGEVFGIGRNPDNGIVLGNDSVSRHHAEIHREGESHYKIRDKGSKNGVLVNGQLVSETLLQDGDLIQIGDFAFRFNLPQWNGRELVAHASPAGLADVQSAPEIEVQSTGKAPNKRVLIYGGVALILALVLMFGNEKPKENNPTSTGPGSVSNWKDAVKLAEPSAPQKAVDKELAAIEDPTLTKAEQQLESIRWNDQETQESERYFRAGQRDYFNKNYHRAIQSFETSLSFNQKHPLAKYYWEKSVVAAEKEATLNMDTGVRYYQSLQYSRAIYHFQQVVALMNHRPTVMEDGLAKKMIEDAKKYIEICQKQLQAAEIFP